MGTADALLGAYYASAGAAFGVTVGRGIGTVIGAPLGPIGMAVVGTIGGGAGYLAYDFWVQEATTEKAREYFGIAPDDD